MIVPVCPCGGKAQKIAAHFEKHIHLFQLFVPGSSILFSHYIFHTKGIIRKATHKRSYIYEARHSLFIGVLQNYVQCVGYEKFCCHLGNPRFTKSSTLCVLFLVFLCHVACKCKESLAFTSVC